jgi:hypothetical protein
MSMRYGFSLKLDCDNAAFADGQRPNEVARILRRLADQIEIVPLADNGTLCACSKRKAG